MSKPTNKSLIGAFVIGATALLIAALAIFGSGKFFTETERFVMFFEGSAKGLNVGAPVVFNGVKIGQVVNVNLIYVTKTRTFLVQVIVETDPKNVSVIGGDMVVGKGANVSQLIEEGLRAQLQMQSFVTGQLMVGVGLYPDKPARIYGLDKKYKEIPTIPTPLEQIARALEEINIQMVFEKVSKALDGIDRFVNSKDFQGSAGALHKLFVDTDLLVKNVNEKIGPLAESLTGASNAARGAFMQAENSLALKEGVPGEIGKGLTETVDKMRVALESANTAFASIEMIAESNSNLAYELNETLQEFSRLARSLRVLAEYLEQHPDSLIKAKKERRKDAKGELP